MANIPVTPPALGPTGVLVGSLLVSAALGLFATWREGALAPRGEWLARGLVALAVAVVLGGACLWWLDGMARGLAPLVGLVVGAFSTAKLRASAEGGEGPALGIGMALLAALALGFGQDVPLANAAIGFVAGTATFTLAWRLAAPLVGVVPAAEAVGAAPAVLALVAGAGAWGEKLWPEAHVGWPLALALGTWLVASHALGRLAGGKARFVAPVAYALGAAAVLGGLFGGPAGMMQAALAGALAALVLPVFLTERDDLARLGRMALLLAGGALLVLDNRLFGIVAIAFGGLGLGAGAVGGPARGWLGLVVALFAARTWIQLFLDRTALTGYGVDLTHPYSFAALIAGALVPGAAFALQRAAGGHRGLATASALLLALAPAALGYYMHVEAIGGWLAGLALGTFALAASAEPPEPGPAWLPSLLLANVSVALLSAPWLVVVMNATRDARVTALCGFAAALTGLAFWWWLVRGRETPAAPAAAAPTEG